MELTGLPFQKEGFQMKQLIGSIDRYLYTQLVFMNSSKHD